MKRIGFVLLVLLSVVLLVVVGCVGNGPTESPAPAPTIAPTATPTVIPSAQMELVANPLDITVAAEAECEFMIAYNQVGLYVPSIEFENGIRTLDLVYAGGKISQVDYLGPVACQIRMISEGGGYHHPEITIGGEGGGVYTYSDGGFEWVWVWQ